MIPPIQGLEWKGLHRMKGYWHTTRVFGDAFSNKSGNDVLREYVTFCFGDVPKMGAVRRGDLMFPWLTSNNSYLPMLMLTFNLCI